MAGSDGNGTGKSTFVIDVFFEYGILTIFHNTTPSVRKYIIVGDEEFMGPKAEGVIVAVIFNFAG